MASAVVKFSSQQKFIILTILMIVPTINSYAYGSKYFNQQLGQTNNHQQQQHQQLGTDKNIKEIDLSDEEPSKLFSGYRDSYITKDAASKLRQRLKKYKKPYSVLGDKDDQLIQSRSVLPLHKESAGGKSKKIIYDKKYFDYLPADHIETSAGTSDELSNTNNNNNSNNEEDDKPKQRINSRRFRRQVEDSSNTPLNRTRRQYPYKYQTYKFYPQTVFIPHNSPMVQTPYAGWGYQVQYQPYQQPLPPNYYLPIPRPQPPYDNSRPSPPFLPVPTYIPQIPQQPQDDGNPIGTRIGVDAPQLVLGVDDLKKNNFYFGVIYDRDRIPNYSGNSIPATTRAPPRQPAPTFRPSVTSTTVRPFTTTKPTSIFHESGDDDFDWDSLQEQVNAGDRNTIDQAVTTRRPLVQPAPAPSTQGPFSPNNDFNNNGNSISQPPTNQPSACVWAIVSCCSQNNNQIRYSCFERIGCHGAFWDFNPCSTRLMQAALGAAEQFYDDFN
uniref:Putative secreted mucin n=1 Tax=Corethrella appendiculata TaxID=1370023 RepID=U5ELU2_9DIPT